MPHCILEYSRETLAEGELTTLLGRLHAAILDTGLYPIENIKVRAIPVDHALVAGVTAPFLHVMLRILDGKTSEQRRLLSRVVFESLVSNVPGVESISVEVVEMERDSYVKRSPQI